MRVVEVQQPEDASPGEGAIDIEVEVGSTMVIKGGRE